MKNKPITLYLAMALLFGCAKPLQPVPPEFKLWHKSGELEEKIKATMLSCGYPDISGGDNTDSQEIIAEAEQCMVRNGFKRKGSWKGVCSLASSVNLAACQVDPQPINF